MTLSRTIARRMRWLLHGNLTPAVGDALVRHGHTADRVGRGADRIANRDELIELVRKSQRDLVTTDSEFVHYLIETPTRLGRSVVHLQLDGADVEQDDAIDRLFKRYKRLKPGMLYTVTETRVKVRQLPSGLASPRESI